MKVINLDKFSSKRQVEIDGATYDIRTFTVGDYIDGKLDAVSAKANEVGDSTLAQIKIMIDVAAEYSTIPRETLTGFNMGMLQALIQVIQGVDVEEAPASGDKGNE